MGGSAFRAATAVLLMLSATVLWPTSALRQNPVPPSLEDVERPVVENTREPGLTRSDDTSTPKAISVVGPDQMSYRLLDERAVTFPSGYYPDLGPGLVLTDYPYGASPSLIPGLTSPYQTRLPVYNYSTDVFREYAFSSPFGGGFTSPGDVTAVSGPDATYLFTVSHWGGDGSALTYSGQNFSWPVSNVIDFPRPSGLATLNFLIPVTGQGYSLNEVLWIVRGWSLDGYNLIGHVTVSRYIGNPPRTGFLYFVNLSNPEFLDVTRVHEVSPALEIPWDAPLGWGFFERANPSVLFNVRVHYVGSDYTFEYTFYDLVNSTGITFPAPSFRVDWHERRGDLLYLLLGTTTPSRPFERPYTLVQVDLARAGDFGNLTADAITEVWQKTFWQDYTNYYPILVVRNDSLVVLEGSIGYEPESGPRFESITTYGIFDGALRSQEVLGLTAPRWRLRDPAYPLPLVRAVYGSYLLDLDRNLVYVLDMADLETFIYQRTGRVQCSFCFYHFYVTDYSPSRVRLFAFGFDSSNFSTGLFASVEINIGSPPPNAPPTALFTHSPTAYDGVRILFDASTSYDVDSVIRSYTWDFGDGTSGVGPQAQHAYATAGSRTVSLTVVDSRGLTGVATATTTVHTLVLHDDPAGFRLPVPDDWSLQTGVSGAELRLIGPVHNATVTSMTVASKRNPAVTEDIAYLDGVANELLQGIRMEHPDASVEGDPSFQRLAGHLADVFLVRYGSGKVAAKIAIIASADHERWWALWFEIDSALYPIMDPIFVRILSGFAITLPTPGEVFWTAIGMLGVCGFGALVPAILLTLWPRWKARDPLSGKAVAAAGSARSRCPECGAVSVPDGKFCWRCGGDLVVKPRTK